MCCIKKSSNCNMYRIHLPYKELIYFILFENVLPLILCMKAYYILLYYSNISLWHSKCLSFKGAVIIRSSVFVINSQRSMSSLCNSFPVTCVKQQYSNVKTRKRQLQLHTKLNVLLVLTWNYKRLCFFKSTCESIIFPSEILKQIAENAEMLNSTFLLLWAFQNSCIVVQICLKE